MTDLPALANLLVGGGVSAVMVALITGFFGRATRKGDYAHKMVEASGSYALRADQRVVVLEEKTAKQERQIDRLKNRLWQWGDLLRQALPYVRACGDEALAARITTALESGTPQDDPPAPDPAG